MVAVNGGVSVGITVLVVGEKLILLDYNAYTSKLIFQKFSASFCVHSAKCWFKEKLTEGLSVETVVREDKCEMFHLNFK